MRITERYSCLELTYDSNRAIALSGIAQEAAASGRGGKYLAGWWSKRLPHQLLWRVTDTHRKPKEYIAPSWSWLSAFGRVNYGSVRMDFHGHRSNIDIRIRDAAVVESKPDGTGKIESGFLLIDAKALDMKAEVVDASKGGLIEMGLTSPAPHIQSANFQSDYEMEREEAETAVKVVILYWGKVTGEETFMVLREACGNPGTEYTRLGLLKADGDRARLL
jgi:hypothetical protein